MKKVLIAMFCFSVIVILGGNSSFYADESNPHDLSWTDQEGIIPLDSSIQAVDYKINAQTDDLTVQISSKDRVNSDDLRMQVQDDNGNIYTTQHSQVKYLGQDDNNNYIYKFMTENINNHLSDKGIYTVSILYNDTDKLEIPSDSNQDGVLDSDAGLKSFKIQLPEMVADDSSDTEYMSIGDTINKDTDIDHVSLMNKVPSVKADSFGVYELESIGYEDANTDMVNNAEVWNQDDYTLAKYDHVIRPIDGNYIISNNIDASDTQNNTNSDLQGGFNSGNSGKEGITDGFRPIGQKVDSQTDGTDSIYFTGTITGDVDMIEDKNIENTYISNLYIIETNYNDVGLLAKAKNMNINNIGLVDPTIAGNMYVGSLIGLKGQGDQVDRISNVYALSTTHPKTPLKTNEKFNVYGKKDTGSLVGLGYGLNISSDDRFKGTIPGYNNELEYEGRKPFLDGYKSFSNLIVDGADYYGAGDNYQTSEESIMNYTGGIVGRMDIAENDNNLRNSIDKVYYNGYLYGINYVGGISGYTRDVDITNTYNDGLIYGQGYIGGLVGKTAVTDKNNLNTFANVFNSGAQYTLYHGENYYKYIYGDYKYIGGLVGVADDVAIENAFSKGSIDTTLQTDLYSEKDYEYVGGITGGTLNNSTIIIQDVYSCPYIDGESKYVGGISGYIPDKEAALANDTVSKLTDVETVGGEIKSENQNEVTLGSTIGYYNSDKSYNINNSYISDGLIIEDQYRNDLEDDNTQASWYNQISGQNFLTPSWWSEVSGFEAESWLFAQGQFPQLYETDSDELIP